MNNGEEQMPNDVGTSKSKWFCSDLWMFSSNYAGAPQLEQWTLGLRQLSMQYTHGAHGMQLWKKRLQLLQEGLDSK